MPFCHASVLQEITDDIKIKQELKSGTQGTAVCHKMKCSNYILMLFVINVVCDYCADPQQHGFYLFYTLRSKMLSILTSYMELSFSRS